MYLIILALAVALILYQQRRIKNKDNELQSLLKEYSKLVTSLGVYDFEEVSKKLELEYIESLTISKKQKKAEKILAKKKKDLITMLVKEGAYDETEIEKGKYVFTNQQIENAKADTQALTQLVSQAARISWTIADAASVDAANEGAVNIVDYQLEWLITGYLESFEEKYGFENVVNCARNGLNFVQVSQAMKERSYILFPKKYQDELFSIEDDKIDDGKEMEKVYFELGGEEKFDAILNWASLNLGRDEWEKFKTTYSKASDENDYETLKNLMLAAEQIQIQKEKSE